MLATDGACFGCLDKTGLEVVKLALLCRILQILDPMATCDPVQLMQDGACFACLDAKQLKVVELQLLCNIAGESGGGGGVGGVTSGAGNPVAPPASGNGFYYKTTDSSVWAWDSALAMWVPVIV